MNVRHLIAGAAIATSTVVGLAGVAGAGTPDPQVSSTAIVRDTTDMKAPTYRKNETRGAWFYKYEGSPVIRNTRGKVVNGRLPRGSHLNIILTLEGGQLARIYCDHLGGRFAVQTVRGDKFNVCMNVDF